MYTIPAFLVRHEYMCMRNAHVSGGNPLLLVVILPEQETTDTKDDCQYATQEKEIDQHARGPKDVVCGDSIGSPSSLVSILHDIVVSAEVTVTIKVRYIVVEASLVSRRTGARCVMSARAGSVMLMRAL
jgi:hypothetical protein